MKAKLINGVLIANEIKSRLKIRMERILQSAGAKPPNLTAIQIGDNDACSTYIKNQKNSCEALGISHTLTGFNASDSEQKISEYIKKANGDKNITGIILHTPVPKNINQMNLQAAIDPLKDVEGITPANLGMLFYHDVRPTVTPCTALSVMECLKSTGVPLKGKEVVIVGHSEIVGKSLCLMLLSSLYESATPTVCHIATKNLETHTGRADVLIVAVGKTEFIKGNMVKKGAIVIDVGINRKQLPENRLDDKNQSCVFKTVGDVDFGEVSEIAEYITPVPGGVGPVTTAMLLENLVSLYELQNRGAR